MNKLALYGAMCLLFMASASQLPAWQDGDDAVVSREESISIDLVATISGIDYESRELQLKDAQGHERKVTAAPRVLRFNELKVGDQVSATLEISATAELREPTEEELAKLDEVMRGVVRLPGEGPLAGSLVETTTSVVTVVGLDLLSRIVTVMNEDGYLVDVKAQSEDNLKKMRLGDSIVISYTAAIAASVIAMTPPGDE